MDARGNADELRCLRATYAMRASGARAPACGVGGPLFTASARNTHAGAEPAESPATHERLLSMLSSSGAPFRLSSHAATRTSAESAAVRGVPLSSGAKALLVKASGGRLLAHGGPYLLAVMSAARAVDWKALRAAAGCKQLALAALDDVWALTGCVVGAVPPFGSLFAGCATLVDRSLVDQGPEINFNAALRTQSVLGLPVAAYLALEKPALAHFTTAEEDAAPGAAADG
jgi:Ala-tRNA(Pro) deacylase